MIPVQPLVASAPAVRSAVRPVSAVAPVRALARAPGLLERAREPQQLAFDFRPVAPGPAGRP